MKNIAPKHRTLLSVVLVICLALGALFGGNYLLQSAKEKRLAEEYQTQKAQIASLSATTTPEELEALGILNGSKVQAEPSEAFQNFYNKKAGSFAFFKEDEAPLTVQLYHFSDNKLVVEHYDVAERQWRYNSSFAVFPITTERVQGENGVWELWLHRTGTAVEGVFPDWQDYLLYRYTEA